MSNEDEKFKETQAEAKKKGLTLNIDNQRFEELARENERLKVEKENKDYNPSKINEQLKSEVDDLKGKLGLIAEKALSDKKKSLGLDPNNSMSPEEVMGYEKGLESGSGKQTPSGSAPLNSAQLGEQIKSGSYSSVEEMINDLRDRAEIFKGTSQGNEAEAILNELFKKGLAGQKENQQLFRQYSKPLPELVEKYGLKIPADKNDGDLQQFNKAFRRRKKLERENKGVS